MIKMRIFKQKKYKILIFSIVIYMAVFNLLYASYSFFQTPLAGYIFYVTECLLISFFLWNLKKENLKPFIKTVINIAFISFSIAWPVAFVLDLMDKM